MGTSKDILIDEIYKKKEIIKKKNKELQKYKKAYNILMDYWDSISEEEQPEVDKRLKKLGL